MMRSNSALDVPKEEIDEAIGEAIRSAQSNHDQGRLGYQPILSSRDFIAYPVGGKMPKHREEGTWRPYADRLNTIRDIYFVVAREGEVSKDHLFELVAEQVPHPTSSDLQTWTRKWKQRLILEYIEAAQQLYLIELRDDDTYILTSRYPIEKQLILGAQNLGKREFKDTEKRAFRTILLDSRQIQQFLAWFMDDGMPPKSYEDFISDSSQAISLREVHKDPESATRGPNEYFARGKWHEIAKETVRITWTNRYWCRDAGLIDWIRVDPKEIRDREHDWECYPVKYSRDNYTIDEFVQLVLEEFSIRVSESVRISIPKILYRFGARHFIAQEDIKALLLRANKKYPTQFYLEQVSSTFFNERYKNTYLKMGGYYRGYVAIKGGLRQEVEP